MIATADIRRQLLAVVSAVVALAATQSGVSAEPVVGRFALDRHEPTPAGDRFFDVPSGSVDGALALRAGLSLDYAHEPLVLRSAAGEVLGSAVTGQMVTHAGASLALWDQVLVSLSLPLALVNTGADPSDSRSAAASPSGASFGDLRLGARVQLFGAPRSAAELALGTYLWFPTGDPAQYTGDENVRSMPHLAFGGVAGSFVYGATLGVTIRETVEMLDVSMGTAIGYGAAAGVQLLRDRLVVGAEAVGSTVVASAAEGDATSAEIHATARLRIGDFAIGAAAGPGLGRAAGTPTFRALTTVQYVGVDVRRKPSPAPARLGAR